MVIQNDWVFTPYNQKTDNAMYYLHEFNEKPLYQNNLSLVFDYIYKLESIIEDNGLQGAIR